MNPSQLQRLILEVLARSGTDRRLGGGRHYLAEAIASQCPQNDRPTPRQIQEAIWALIARGLAFLDISQSAPENWSLELTQVGTAALRDEQFNPDDPDGYLNRLYERVPTISPLVRMYLGEALQTYFHECYLASTVMVGVACEAAFLEMAGSFAAWVGGGSGANLQRVLSNPRATYVQRFDEFRRRFQPEIPRLPSQLADGLAVQIDAVIDLLRVYRNDAGHPTGRVLSRDDCFTNLRIFARLVGRLYALRSFFEAAQAQG